VFKMKNILVIFLLTLVLQTWTKADDISDFEIEGISIGDSLLDHFSKERVDKKGQALYPNKEMLAGTFKDNSFEIFEEIQFHWLANDKEYIIQSLSANIDFPNDITKCLEKRKNINEDIAELFTNPKKDDWGKRALMNVDPSGQTYAYQNVYWLNNGNIIVSCRDFGINKENEGHKDYLAIMIDSKIFDYWINNKAWD
tara:strand:- start:26 stop:619 length:594 start_codon:yes stop_codon:yes gene_type:complete